MKSIGFAAALSLVFAGVSPALATINLGDTVTLTYFFPDTTTNVGAPSSGLFSPALTLTVNFSDAVFDSNSVQVFQTASGYTAGSFNGVEITDATNSAAFAGWTVKPDATIVDFTEQQIGGSIFVNWQGSPGMTVDNPTPQVSIGASTAIPEPSTWAMMVLGFAGLGFAGYRHAKGRAAVAA
jgi:hypothetical protein